MISDDPTTHQESMSRDDSDRWKVAMQEKCNSRMANETWTLTELPEVRKDVANGSTKRSWMPMKTLIDTRRDL